MNSFKRLFSALSLSLIILIIIPASGEDKIILNPHEIKKYAKSKRKVPPSNLRIHLKVASAVIGKSVCDKFIKKELFAALDRISNGLVQIELVTGEAFPDEHTIVENFTKGKYHGIGVSGMAAAELVPEFSVLGAPLIFDYEPDLYWNGKYTEIDYILEKIEPMLASLSYNKGYQFCGLSEASLCFVGSDEDIKSAVDFGKLKCWASPHDQAREKVLKAMGAASVSITQLSGIGGALSDGRINSIPAGHCGVIHYKLAPHLKYISDYPLYGYECAVVLFDKDVLLNIDEFVRRWGDKYAIKNRYRFRKNFLRVMDFYLSKKMRFIVRKQEAEAREYLIEEGGLKEIKIPDEEIEKLRERAEGSYMRISDEKETRKLAEEILDYRRRYRNLKEAGKITDKWYEKGIVPDGNQQERWRF